MGIAGLIAGRMLGLPVIAQYHTEVAEYAGRMTGLPFVRDLVGPLVGWFYRQAELCLAPSEAVVQRLLALGVPAERVRRIRRGVDLELFQPARRDRGVLARFGVGDGDGPVALYVGRLSKEKNLDALGRAWAEVHAARPDARLLVVGEGPLAGAVSGPGTIVAGPLFGEELAAVFASADVFAFPSETETFGNVVVEAAASGLPAVVAAAGAAHEHVADGETGLVIDGADPRSLARALLALLGDPARRQAMGRAARARAAGYDLAAAVRSTWDIYRELGRGAKSAAPPRSSLPSRPRRERSRGRPVTIRHARRRRERPASDRHAPSSSRPGTSAIRPRPPPACRASSRRSRRSSPRPTPSSIVTHAGIPAETRAARGLLEPLAPRRKLGPLRPRSAGSSSPRTLATTSTRTAASPPPPARSSPSSTATALPRRAGSPR